MTTGARALPHLVLGIETSCDETAAAVVGGRGRSSGRRWCRARSTCTPGYGGVVPELAGRAHVELLTPVVAEALAGAGLDAGRHRARRRGRHLRPGPGGLAAGRAVGGQGPGPGLGRALRRASTTSRATSSPPCSRRPTSAGQWSSCWCRAATPC